MRRFVQRLAAIAPELSGRARAQLVRDVTDAVRTLPNRVQWGLDALGMRRGHRIGKDLDNKSLVKQLREIVHDTLDTVIPPTAGNAADVRPAGSVLPPASRALAQGRVATNIVDDHHRGRGITWWRKQGLAQGLAKITAPLLAEAGDPLEAVRLLPRIAGGIVVGDSLKPVGRAIDNLAVVNANQSVGLFGASGTGKTTGPILGWLYQQLALDANAVVVTPQVNTVMQGLPLAQALTGQRVVPIIDFGGQFIEEGSPGYVTYNVVRGCRTDANIAERRATAPRRPSAPGTEADPVTRLLGQDRLRRARVGHGGRRRNGGGVWPGGRRGRHERAEARPCAPRHPVARRAAQRADRRVRGGAERSRPDGAGSGAVRGGTGGGDEAPPRLRRILFHKHVLEAKGQSFSKELGEAKRHSLETRFLDAAPKDGKDQLETVLGMFFDAVPKREVRVMSPRPNELQVDPRALAQPRGPENPDAGLTFVVYSQIHANGGVGAAMLTDEILAEVVKQNMDDGMRDHLDGPRRGAPWAVVLDEGEAAEHLPGLVRIFTNYRQLDVSMLLSMTSEAQLKGALGETEAGKIIRAPVTIDLSPIDRASEIAKLFGQEVVMRKSYAQSPEGEVTVTDTPHKEDVVDAGDVANWLPIGQGVLINQSPRAGSARVSFLGLSQVIDPSTVFGVAMQWIGERPDTYEPVKAVAERLRPDLARQIAEEKAQLQLEPSAAEREALAEASGPTGDAVADGPVDAEVVDSAVESAVPESGPTEPVVAEPAEPAEGEPVAPAAPADPQQALAASLAQALAAVPTERLAALTEMFVQIAKEPVEPPQADSIDDEPIRPAESEAVEEAPLDPIVGKANGVEVTASEYAVLQKVLGLPDLAAPPASEPVEPDPVEEPVTKRAGSEPVEEAVVPLEEHARKEVSSEPADEVVEPEPVEEPAKQPEPEPLDEAIEPEPLQEPVKETVESEPVEEPVKKKAEPEPVELELVEEPVIKKAEPEPVELELVEEPVIKKAEPEPVELELVEEPVKKKAEPEPVELELVEEPVIKKAEPSRWSWSWSRAGEEEGGARAGGGGRQPEAVEEAVGAGGGRGGRGAGGGRGGRGAGGGRGGRGAGGGRGGRGGAGGGRGGRGAGGGRRGRRAGARRGAGRGIAQGEAGVRPVRERPVRVAEIDVER